MYCVVGYYGGLGSTEHWVHNVCTVWWGTMGGWVVLNIGYIMCVLCGGVLWGVG